jgi:molybdopterin molybdotransferase
MTGAMLPGGCDTVIRYEDVEILDGEAIVKVNELQQGQSVHKQGVDAKTGEVVLERGQKLAPSEIALLASVGKTRVDVLRPARVAVISTGDELVAVEDTPKPWQIRRSNSYALQAALRESGVESRSFHLEDDPEVLKAGLTDITRDFEVMILSGGVSKGRFDYVPQTLEAIGIKKLFHQVSQRPGKPFWFGAGNGKIAFALPGNPVSTFMCFYKYIKPWLLRSMGVEVGETFAVLGKDFTFPPPLTFFLQVSVRNDGGRLVATPVPGGGSGDFANLKNVDGFLELPLEKGEFRSGEVFRYIPFRH